MTWLCVYFLLSVYVLYTSVLSFSRRGFKIHPLCLVTKWEIRINRDGSWKEQDGAHGVAQAVDIQLVDSMSGIVGLVVGIKRDGWDWSVAFVRHVESMQPAVVRFNDLSATNLKIGTRPLHSSPRTRVFFFSFPHCLSPWPNSPPGCLSKRSTKRRRFSCFNTYFWLNRIGMRSWDHAHRCWGLVTSWTIEIVVPMCRFDTNKIYRCYRFKVI